MKTKKSNASTDIQQQQNLTSAAEKQESPFFSPVAISTKLTIGAPNDPYEQEADRMADQVLRKESSITNNNNLIQRACQKCVEGENLQRKVMDVINADVTPIQRQETVAELEENEYVEDESKMQTEEEGEGIMSPAKPVMLKSLGKEVIASPDISSEINATKGQGNSLPEGIGSFMNDAFGTDFNDVKIHTDSKAIQMSQVLNARAFTHGSDIYFNKGEYNPDSAQGKHLLAHELTHVVQQNPGKIQPLVQKQKETDYQGAMPKNNTSDITTDNAGKEKFDTPQSPARQIMQNPKPVIQMLPAPPDGTRRFCGFGITTRIPGFVQSHFTGDFDVDYTSGCSWILGNTWSSKWSLYDSSDTLLDENTEWPFGGYSIESSDVSRGMPSDGDPQKWSLWYEVTRSQPWLTDDPDAFPYDYKPFDVYSEPFYDPNVRKTEVTGPVIWQNNFTPAEDGAELTYSFSTTVTRTETDTQTEEITTQVSGEQSTSFGVEYAGLTGGFSRKLSASMTRKIARTHSVSVANSRTESNEFKQPNLRRGVTYRVQARPIYYVLTGSVEQISHRNGVIKSNDSETIQGGIKTLKGLDIRIVTDED